MKKRTIAKQNKRLITDKVFNQLKKANIKVTNVRWLDGYFLWQFGKNSVCHFVIKDLPDFKFGVWIKNDRKSVTIFGENILYIDKFKPTQNTNFTIDKIIDFVTKYKNKEINLRYIVEGIFEHTNLGGEWIDDKYVTKEFATYEEWEAEYNKEIAEQRFRNSHFGMGYGLWERYEKALNNVIDYLKNTDFIEYVFLKEQSFFMNPYSVEFLFNEKVDLITDKELHDWHNKLLSLGKYVGIYDHEDEIDIDTYRLPEREYTELKKLLYKQNKLNKEWKQIFKR